jgi:hypothetical protein
MKQDVRNSNFGAFECLLRGNVIKNLQDKVIARDEGS